MNPKDVFTLLYFAWIPAFHHGSLPGKCLVKTLAYAWWKGGVSGQVGPPGFPLAFARGKGAAPGEKLVYQVSPW